MKNNDYNVSNYIGFVIFYLILVLVQSVIYSYHEKHISNKIS